MKQLIFTLFSLFLVATLSAQQGPLYLMYNSSCMDQLEYRYIYSGTSVVSYSINPTANEQYILTTGSSGLNAPTLPPNTVNCRDYALNEKFLNEVNNVTRQVYIVLQQQRGYLLVPVISATQIIRSGTYYLFRAPNYSFAIDTSNLVYESNIATGSSNWYIYFNGLKIRGCYYEYSFKREPTKVSQERSEFDFIPGIGITTERTGMTAVEAENNQYRLVKMNGMALEDYIVSRCQGKVAPSTAPVSKYTPQVNYGATGNDKETASMPNYDPPPIGPNPPAGTGLLLVNCPEYPGEGYHIVQPGETLNGISRAYNISVKSLVNWNGLQDPDLILVCQKIWLRKPPASVNTMATKGEQKLASNVPEGPVVRRQDAYWNANANTSYEPAPYSLTQQPKPTYTAPAAKSLVHTVQKGETLYGIGLRYQLTESEIRRLNNLPASGQVVLQPGMQILVADCCPNNSGTVPSNPGFTYPDLNTQAAQPYYQPQQQPAQPYYQPQQQPATQPYYQPQQQPTAQPYYQPQQGQPSYNPAAVNTTPTTGVLPELYYTPSGTQPTAVNPGGVQPNAIPQTAKKPTYFQEYIVREGDTINSIAIKFKVNAQELALVNNKEPNETLIAGQRLLIPRS